jgi:ligand-binding sensor domain-containing protein/putative methionine-R-sulfoxide reductase with GAF domain
MLLEKDWGLQYFAYKLRLKKIVVILFSFGVWGKLMSQSNPVFYNLNTANGLSYIGVNDMCVDKKGNLWVATGNGLNMFNGKIVDKYFASEYPQLQSSNIVHVICDNQNRIWVLTAGGYVSMLDENRQLHRVSIYRDNKWARAFWIFNSSKNGISIYAPKGNYVFNSYKPSGKNDSISQNQFTFLPLNGYDTIGVRGFNRSFNFDDNSYLLVYEDLFFKINLLSNTVEKKYFIPHLTALAKWGDHALLAFDRNTKEVKAIDLVTEKITYPFKDLKDQFGKSVKAFFYFTEKINEDEYAFTTFNEGIYLYNRRSGKIFNYRHNIADPFSISNNTQTTLTLGQKGWMFFNCNPNGISYFNTQDFIANQTVFTDNKGNGFDGYIAGIATKDNNTYYIGTAESLLKWNRNTNTTSFSHIKDAGGEPIFKNGEVISLLIDKNDHVWATTLNNGIVVTDKNLKLICHLKYSEKNEPNTIHIKQLRRLVLSPSGNDVWACGSNGICKINTQTFFIDALDSTPLYRFRHQHCAPLIFTDKDNIWFASGGVGLFHYNLITQQLDSFNTQTGLISNYIFDINKDNFKNIYIGTISGLNILFPDGRIKTLTQKNGLLIDRAEGLLLDKHNRMWIGNDIGLACYNPSDSSLKTFDERYGLSIYGFRVGSYFQTPNGEFIFGTPRGLQYFHPDSLYSKKLNLNVSVNKIETKNIFSTIAGSVAFKLAARDNQVTFYFSSVDFTPHVRTYYEYKLVDLDKDWIKLADQNSVRYNFLLPGKYIFKVRISNDKKNWQDSDNEVTIVIATPFYQSWWFKSIGVYIGLFLIWYVLRYFRRKQLKQKEELEAQVVINYFASRINSLQKTEDIIWDVAKNCISKLNFEDCVIYLLDEERNVLVQKAAYGPKMSRDFTIYQPIEIPVGKGVVGAVAKTGKPELISNTELDERYVVDDARRYSEVAVPLKIDDKVIGVIDSEHSKKNFFKEKHLRILSTIAILCANQLLRAKAEEEKQKAKIETLENKQKVTESRLQSLRLQMNPHFLFNALNSIQQMILANEEMVATKYLSKFSKLLRTILVHSDKELITLKEELEILNLYIDLESIRFKDSFEYKIECDEDIDTDEVKLPTLLIQPFVENAIWHGLMHKEGDRFLLVKFFEKNGCLHCVVLDNGIGREKSSEIKLATGQGKKHTSKGIIVSMERLRAMNSSGDINGSIQIHDLKEANGSPVGTSVEIVFPNSN